MPSKQSLDRACARWVLGRMGPEGLPAVAQDALELGFDGPALRRLAALERPTFFEVRDWIDRAYTEMGQGQPSKREAAILLAKEIAQNVLSGAKEPFQGAYEIWILGYSCDFPPETNAFGGLDQKFDLPAIMEECRKLLALPSE